MTFKVIDDKELINVGSIYSYAARGPIYCWENESLGIEGSRDDLGAFIQSLRVFGIGPNQIYNVGTENPFLTKKLNERIEERVLYGLERPIIRVLKKYVPGKMSEGKTKLDHPYLIEMGDNSFQCKLIDVPLILRDGLGCRSEDIVLHEEIRGGYIGLNKMEKMFIENGFKDFQSR